TEGLFMEIGIIGLPQSGKSTIFEIMTGVASANVREPFVRGQATIKDERLEHLAKTHDSLLTTPAKIQIMDVNASGEKAWEQLRQHLSAVNGLIHVIDAFTSSSDIDTIAQYKKLEDEMIISDLIIAENRFTKLNKMPKVALKPIDIIQAQALPAIIKHLEAGLPLRTLSLSVEIESAIRSFSFWSIKPQVVVINKGEEDIGDDDFSKLQFSSPTIGICAKVELELLALSENERKEFLSELGITQTAFDRVIKESFSLLGQICFFTAGEKESRTWLTQSGSKAPKAASVIHKDFERGFIKAEVVSYQDFIDSGSSMAKVKEAGKFRLEGKEYIVKEADIIVFRFNV
ncbi:MAG: DUF933 domain-containing protein, partial [Deltaproteobacteria bacterium]